MCPHGMAHWRHIANTIELVLPSAQPNPQPKRQSDRFSRFCTAHGRKSLYFTMGDTSPKIAHSHGGSGLPSNTQFLWPIQAHKPNGISIGSSVFAQMTAVSLYFTMGRPFPPQNCPFRRGDLDRHLIHGSLSPPESSTQMASRSVQLL